MLPGWGCQSRGCWGAIHFQRVGIFCVGMWISVLIWSSRFCLSLLLCCISPMCIEKGEILHDNSRERQNLELQIRTDIHMPTQKQIPTLWIWIAPQHPLLWQVGHLNSLNLNRLNPLTTELSILCTVYCENACSVTEEPSGKTAA